MKRRDSLKALLVGTIGSAAIISSTSCEINNNKITKNQEDGLYGRTPDEIEHDEKVNAEEYLNAHELATIAVLCDIILPATPTAGSATDAKVPAFIDFIVKDLPVHQLPMRGGLMWLDGEANKRFNKEFIACSPEEEPGSATEEEPGYATFGAECTAPDTGLGIHCCLRFFEAFWMAALHRERPSAARVRFRPTNTTRSHEVFSPGTRLVQNIRSPVKDSRIRSECRARPTMS